MHSDNIEVQAIGVTFTNVGIAKQLTFQAFNNLPGVTISNFMIPGQTSDSLIISTDSLIPSPSNLGIELGTVGFVAYFMGNEVGPIVGKNLFLAEMTTTKEHLDGNIIRQTGDGIRTTGILFSQYLQGVNQTLQVQGDYVIPPAQPNRPVNWLTTAFKTLTLNVILPGMRYTIIEAIMIQDLTLTILNQAQAYDVPTSNNKTVAVFANPCVTASILFTDLFSASVSISRSRRPTRTSRSSTAVRSPA